MLRGYHPLKEIYRWERVILMLYFLFGGVIILGIGVEHTDIANRQEDIALAFAVSVIFLLFWSLLRYPPFRRITKLFRLQKAILNSQDGLILLTTPEYSTVEDSLPVSASTSISKVLWRSLAFSLLFMIGCIFVFQLPFLLPDPYVLPLDVWAMIPPFLVLLCMIPPRSTLPLAADFYLLPSLEVDESGILACYGTDQISIAWQQIRFFALAEYKKFGDNKKMWTQIYLICDGENTIAWHADPHGKTWKSASLSTDEKYARLLEKQLPTLVSLKTGLPLFDLRGPQRAKSASLASGV